MVATLWRARGRFVLACAIVLGTSLFIVVPKIPRLHVELYQLFAARDVWFDGDLARILSSETDRNGNHYRNKVHPFFSIATYPAVRLVQSISGSSALEAALLVQTVAALGLVLAFMLLLRRLRQELIDVFLAGLLLATSATFLFWTVALESRVLGGLSLVLALHLLIGLAGGQVSSAGRLISAGLVSFGITIANWVLALLVTVRTAGIRRALRIALITLVIAAGATLVQRYFFRGSGVFFVPSSEEANYVQLRPPAILAARVWSLVFSSIAAPFPVEVAQTAPRWPLLTMISPVPDLFEKASRWTIAAWGCWALLMCLAISRRKDLRAAPIAIQATVGFLIFQLGLHAFYGNEPFLYGLHSAPLMIILVASTFPAASQSGRSAAFRRVLMLACAACSLIANREVFDRAITMTADSKREFYASMSEQDRTIRFVADHPEALSPLGNGHVLFGVPNAGIEDKGYIEPVGLFSPAPRSFGIQVLLAAPGGALAGSVPIGPVSGYQQHISLDPATHLPLYVGRVPAGRIEISPIEAAGEWTMSVEQSPSAIGMLGFDVRSIGPAGGPISSMIRTSASSLVINDQWRLTWSAPIVRFLAGDESVSSALAETDARMFSSQTGWLRARAFFDSTVSNVEVRIERTSSPGERSARHAPAVVWPTTRVPDVDFSGSMAAQAVHLGMSLDQGETRAGDPLNYPHEWVRSGAYVVVALAASGNVALSERVLAGRFHVDYSGDAGAEADAPGLSLWALDEVYKRGRNRDLVSRLWPHVVRKVALIERCLLREGPGFSRSVSSSPVRSDLRIPADIVCGQPLGGLIAGRVDRYYPLAYVNAVSFAGLKAASALALVVDEKARSTTWAAEAEVIRAAWSKTLTGNLWGRIQQVADDYPARGFLAGDKDDIRFRRQVAAEYLFTFSNDDRFSMSALWPFGIGWRDDSAVQAVLEKRLAADWAATGQMTAGPRWTYFKLATAHQWLLLGHAENVWRYLDWFWRHQSSPGLYAWAEGKSGANPDGLWGATRGWLSNAGGTTPHYWTAAEMLLLQLDMLAYTRVVASGGSATTELVIGAGVPDNWKTSELSIGPIVTSVGNVCWHWRDNTLTVSATDGDTHTRVVAAGAFSGQPIRRSPDPCRVFDTKPYRW